MKKQALRIGNYFNGKVQLRDNRLPGFTIVELLIVIVVIGILAAISIVAYNGIQQRASRSARISQISSLMKKLEMYKIENDSLPGDETFAGRSCGGSSCLTYAYNTKNSKSFDYIHNSTYGLNYDLFNDGAGLPECTVYANFKQWVFLLVQFETEGSVPRENRIPHRSDYVQDGVGGALTSSAMHPDISPNSVTCQGGGIPQVFYSGKQPSTQWWAQAVPDGTGMTAVPLPLGDGVVLDINNRHLVMRGIDIRCGNDKLTHYSERFIHDMSADRSARNIGIFILRKP